LDDLLDSPRKRICAGADTATAQEASSCYEQFSVALFMFGRTMYSWFWPRSYSEVGDGSLVSTAQNEASTVRAFWQLAILTDTNFYRRRLQFQG